LRGDGGAIPCAPAIAAATATEYRERGLKKLALVFVLAIFAPALLLGVLALRTAGRQRLIMEQQEVELRQKETDELAEKVRVLLGDEQKSFLDAVDRLRAREGAQGLTEGFAEELPREWGRDCIGFAVDQNGVVVSPRASAASDAETRDFLRQNAAFLGNQAAAEVYEPSAKFALKGEAKAAIAAAPGRGLEGDLSRADSAPMGGRAEAAAAAPEGNATAATLKENYSADASDLDRAKAVAQKLRAVSPQNQGPTVPAVPVSQLYYATSRFRQLVANGHDGVLARYVEDELVVTFWVRPAGLDQTVLGAQMKAPALFQAIRPGIDPFASRDACMAILDDRAQPVALSVPGFAAAWKNPFVATELGEALPHWEAALYLLHPDSVSQSAHLITLTLYGLVGLAIGAIAWGSFLIAADTRRQVVLAQKKTDFVSNVSHELKTPLTSIRMFAELLQERRVTDPAKTADYLRIIRLEAERLTRLINNVLDFARLERGQKHYTRSVMDLRPEVERLWEAQSEHLRAQGFETLSDIGAGPWWALVDSDAIVQVIVNLLSNAEKYSIEKKKIEFRAGLQDGEIRISILDRGAGVPAGEEKKIFEGFYRAHDSLSSGIPGSGLGLTLAVRIARDHGGDIRCERRLGGGSIFTLSIPAEAPL
jgi:signal transduction histidine kinase